LFKVLRENVYAGLFSELHSNQQLMTGLAVSQHLEKRSLAFEHHLSSKRTTKESVKAFYIYITIVTSNNTRKALPGEIISLEHGNYYKRFH
jgi:hypothetical protein